jgi:hypothetical protein
MGTTLPLTSPGSTRSLNRHPRFVDGRRAEPGLHVLQRVRPDGDVGLPVYVELPGEEHGIRVTDELDYTRSRDGHLGDGLTRTERRRYIRAYPHAGEQEAACASAIR